MIQVKNLTFGYKKYKKLFSDLSLELKPDNIYGLLGKNGAGKTTLLRLMTGLLYPDFGECLMYNKKACDRLPSVLKDIYFLPEEYSLPGISLSKYTRVNASFYPKFSQDQFNHYVNEFELDINQKLNTMSYGQKKKFLMAFGLATNAVFMVLDEPTNGLDIPSKSQFRKIMASTINSERCYIISTHQVRDLENLIDPVVIVDKGKIIFNQTIDNISSKLVFGDINIYGDLNVIYSEGIEGKQRGVMVNKNNISTSVDLELLFNTVIQQNKQIQTLFNN